MIPNQRLESWTAPESPITIEYSLVVIEEIRREVSEGYQRFSRGGVEVGGALYGTREGRTVRILAMRRIHCEHARGPAFLLSDKDMAALTDQLERDQEDPQLQGMLCVGWFMSHTRSEIFLTSSDLEIFTQFFPDPWQLTMVIRPGRSGSMRAGFFVREADGTLKSDHSHQEFNFPDRLLGVFDTPRQERPPAEPKLAEHQAEHEPEHLVEPSKGPVPLPRRILEPSPMQDLEAPEFLPPEPPRKRQMWWLAGALAAVALLFGVYMYFPLRSASEPLSLTVLEREGQLQIEWNRAARPVLGAVRGSIEIVDGRDSRTIPLANRELQLGKFTYARNTGDVEVRMTVESSGGDKTQEASRFLGRPPDKVNSGEAQPSDQRRAELEAEVTRLQKETATQNERIQQLERTLRIMQSRTK